MWRILIILVVFSTPLFAAGPSVQEALKKESAGDYEGAQAIYEAFIKENPNHEAAIYGLGQVHYWQGDYKKSLETYQVLLAINPEHVPAMIGLSKVYLALGEQKKADEMLRQAKKIDPENEELADLSPQMERKTRIRIYGGYTVEDLSYFADNTQVTYQEIEVSKEKKYGFGLRTAYLRKFDNNGLDTRLSGHYYFREKTRADLGFSFAPSVMILAQESATAGLAHSIGMVTPELHYAFENYSQADRHLITPAVFFEPIKFLKAGGGYEYQRLLFGGGHRDLHSGFADLRVALGERFGLHGFYKRTQSAFEGGRPGGAFVSYSAHVGGGGISLGLMENYAVTFDASTERRNNGEAVNSYTLAFGISL
ncbi:MAG: tetratricopeptide repeat protein [Deltaproteobacteria bacterium]|nr:tetratricopeptide repeat protein [Deltaproteobacteria bacterium]